MDLMLKVWEKVLKGVGFKQFGNMVEIIRANGGVTNSFWKLYRYDDVKKGTLVGTDVYGNRYYHNKEYYFFGRSRWVEYNERFNYNHDASHVPPEWYGWLHYKTDYLPAEDPYRPNYPWMLETSENLTGAKDAYTAYSTVKPKITLWEPKSRR